MASAPPRIFSPARRIAARRRIEASQQCPGAARFLIDDMVEDALDRMDFIRLRPGKALIIGDWSGQLAAELQKAGADVTSADPAGIYGAQPFDLEAPYPAAGFDLVACLGVLETANDLPGALIHMRHALAPGGFALASMIGGGSLAGLRRIMIAADGERPAARMHPQVDIRAGAQLLQRANWADPVVDSHALSVRYPSLERLIGDLRAQGLGNALWSLAPPIGKAGFERAKAAFAAEAAGDKITERFEIVTLSGRRR